MKNKNEAITGQSLTQFEKTVNDYLRNGWRVVPGTVSMCGFGTGRFCAFCVVEKIEEECLNSPLRA